MRDGVLRPGVARFELDRGAAGILGGDVVAGLLEAERVHAEHRVIARHAVRPRRQRARDAVAQHARLAAEEVELVADLQRQQVARVFDRDVLQHLRRRVPAAFDQMVDGVEMALLLRGGGKLPGGIARRARDRNAGRLGAEQMQPRAQRVRHHEIGTLGNRLVDGATGSLMKRLSSRNAVS